MNLHCKNIDKRFGMLSSEIWLPHYEFTLMTIALQYPRSLPDAVVRRSYYLLFPNLTTFFPPPHHAHLYADAIDQYPVQPYLDSRRNLLRWLHAIHDYINERKYNASPTTFKAFMDSYRKLARPDPESDHTSRKRNERILYCAVATACIVLIAMYH